MNAHSERYSPSGFCLCDAFRCDNLLRWVYNTGVSTNKKYMNIRIQGPRLPLTPAIEEYVLKRITPLEKLVNDPAVVCEVDLVKTTNHHKSGEIFRAEINMILPDKHVYLVSEKEDLYQAIDNLREQLDYALSVRKEKKQTLLRRGASRIKDMIKNLRGM